MTTLSFKQYLESKEKLLEAIKNTPVRTVEYTVKKYCKFGIGEDKESRDFISLKPKQTLVVEWKYTNIDNPTPIAVLFEDVDGVDCITKFKPFLSGDKLKKWLSKNTIQESYF
jgi:hypothetical protein